ncbi:MAG TPA: T9SS type A sorting domain-containing protein [Chitinophagales bacterium]|nr:T9SS type A sorting domain-containing protein [Chitinophagales bacterium]
MRKISLPNLVAIMIVMMFLILSNTRAIGQTTLWKNRLNGSGDNADRYNGAVKDAAGNFYLTGYTVSPGTGKDFLTVKLNSAGDTVWTRKYNYVANFDDEANFIVIDALGNITVSGYSDGGSTSTKNDILTIQYNAAGALLWATRYNNAAVNEDEFPASLCVDAANNIFISGRSDHDAGNIDDVITIKYNNLGVQQWAAQYDGGLTDRAAGIVADNAGGCYITGRTDTGGSEDILTISYSSTGTVNWTVLYNGPGGDDRGQAIALDATGNIYVGGIRANASDDDFVTLKYNTAGVLQWSKIVNGGDNDRLTTIKTDALNNVYITGQTDIDAGGNSDYNFRTIKYNSAGVLQWSAITGNPANQEDVPSDLLVDAAGNVYVTGKSDAIAGGAVNFEFMTVKYNSAGAQQWLKYYDGTVANAEDIPSTIIVDAASNVWIAGGVSFTATQKDATFIKYNSTGVFQIAKTYNGKGDFTDKAKAIATDASNNLFVTGYTLVEAQQRNVLVQKINSAGTTLWSRNVNGTNENDEGLAVTTDAAGNVYVAGYSNGSGTYDDGLILKYNTSGVLQLNIIYNYVASQLDKFVSIAVNPAGDIFVTGYSDSNVDPLITNYDWITLKYNALGILQWATRYNGVGNGDDKAAKLVLSGDKIFVTGYAFNGTNNDIVTIKYDNAGTQLAIATRAGSGGDDEGEDMFISGASVYVTGTEFVTGNLGDYVTIKYDTLLNQLWLKTYNGTADAEDRAYGVSATATDVYVTGKSAGVGSANDIALIRYNASTGAQNWAKRYTGAGALNDEGYNVVTDGGGNIYTGGVTGNAATVADFVALNYNTAGTKLLTLKYNGTGNNEDVGKQVILDNNGYLYITGYSVGTGTANYDFSTVKFCTPLPEATITAGGATSICIGDSVLLSANIGAGLTYQWKKGAANIAGATSSNYNAKGAGAYKVVVTNSNGCTKTSNTISVTIIICKDGEVINNQMEYTISPNPFGTATQLQLANVNENVQLAIYDITGKLVYSTNIEAGTESIELGQQLLPGAYMMVLENAGSVQTYQLIKAE